MHPLLGDLVDTTQWRSKPIQIDDDTLSSSRLIGSNVQRSGEPTGQLADLAFEGGRLVGMVLFVGGASGTRQRQVAFDSSPISIRYSEQNYKWTAGLLLAPLASSTLVFDRSGLAGNLLLACRASSRSQAILTA